MIFVNGLPRASSWQRWAYHRPWVCEPVRPNKGFIMMKLLAGFCIFLSLYVLFLIAVAGFFALGYGV